MKADFIGAYLEPSDYCGAVVVGEQIYTVPYGSARTMRIDGNTWETELVGPEGDSREGYSAKVVVDDCAYLIPVGATRIMRINGTTGEVDFIGPKMEGKFKYWCACAIGNRIYAIPFFAPRIMRIDCTTGDVNFVGPTFDSGGKYVSAVAVGGCIYAAPAAAARVLRLELDAAGGERVELVGPDLGGERRKYNCVGVLGQHIYALPDRATRILRITPSVGEYCLVGPDYQGAEPHYQSAATLGGYLYGIPERITAASILRVEERSGRFDLVGPEAEPGGLYRASVVVGKKVHVLPMCRSHCVMSIDGDTGKIAVEGFGSSDLSFWEAIVFRGRIFNIPYLAGQILVLTPQAAVQRAVSRWGTNIADVLVGRHHFFPESFVPQQAAADCLGHLASLGHGAAVRQARAAAASRPLEKQGDFMTIYLYSLDSDFHKQLSVTMHQMDPLRLQLFREYIYHLQRALQRQPCFNGIAFRGHDTLLRRLVYEPGTKVTWQSFSSATRQPMVLVSQNILNVKNGDALIGTIFVIKACSARGITHISDYPEEEEVVFEPNTHFMVCSVVEDPSEKRLLLPGLRAYNLQGLQVVRMEEL